MAVSSVGSTDYYMSQTEINKLNYQVDAFNTELEADGLGSNLELGQEDFLELLITQLTTQDPTDPMDDKEFISQMANFSTLNQMTEMASSMDNFVQQFSFTKAVSLVDKEVSWVTESGNYLNGIVDSIKVKDGEAFLNIGGYEVSLDDITEVQSAGL